MPLQFETSTDEQMAEGGSFISQPGWYHLMITHTDEQPTKRNSSEAIDGFKIEFTSLAGPETEKSIDMIFGNPKMSSRDQGKFARRKQTAFLEASGLSNSSQRGGNVSVELSDAMNRQVVAELELSEPNANGKQYAQLAWTNIYHIDDPRGSKCQKNLEALKLVPASLRRDPASFETKKPDNGGSNGSAGAAITNGSPTGGNGGAAAISSDLGDI